MGLEEIKNLIKGGVFQSPTKGSLGLVRVIEELIDYKKEDPDAKYKIAIGTDSETRERGVEFVCVVAILRIGKGGRYFWFKIHDERRLDFRTRIYQEAVISLALAGGLLETELELRGVKVNMEKPANEAFKSLQNDIGNDSEKEIIFTNELEIHVDVGTIGPTKEMIKEIVGMVKGSGFFVKIKPESFAASSLADKQL
ncbi:MAG: ribonuclease H-like YkuK family protein [bacterium]|nr:ribonuclease H-like YkuK family protein [bacterium]